MRITIGFITAISLGLGLSGVVRADDTPEVAPPMIEIVAVRMQPLDGVTVTQNGTDDRATGGVLTSGFTARVPRRGGHSTRRAWIEIDVAAREAGMLYIEMLALVTSLDPRRSQCGASLDGVGDIRITDEVARITLRARRPVDAGTTTFGFGVLLACAGEGRKPPDAEISVDSIAVAAVDQGDAWR
jgi:hypothetical protein